MYAQIEWLLVLALFTRSALAGALPSATSSPSLLLERKIVTASATNLRLIDNILRPSTQHATKAKRSANGDVSQATIPTATKTVSNDDGKNVLHQGFESSEAFAKDEPSQFCGETLYYVVEYYCVYVKGTGVYAPDSDLDEVISRDGEATTGNKKRYLRKPDETGEFIILIQRKKKLISQTFPF